MRTRAINPGGGSPTQKIATNLISISTIGARDWKKHKESSFWYAFGCRADDFTIRAIRPIRAIRTFRTLRTLRALRTLRTIRTLQTLQTLRTLRALRTIRTIRACHNLAWNLL